MAFSPLLTDLVVLLAGIALVTILFIRMRPRRFYFVRHGETTLNAERIRQGEDGDLSAVGQTQADRAGAYLAEAGIHKILASTYERAKETAEIIEKHLGAPIVYSDLLVERKNPSEIVGKSADDLEVKRVVDLVDLAYHDDSYRYSDEENFIDLKRRGQKGAPHLAAPPGAG